MAVGAVLALVVGVLVGVLLLAEVAGVPGLRRYKAGHLLLATAAIALVCGAAVAASGAVAWAAGAAVLAASSAGVLTWRRSLTSRPAGTPPASPALLVIHGAAASLAFVLVILAAALH
jgi:hypothetical protein